MNGNCSWNMCTRRADKDSLKFNFQNYYAKTCVCVLELLFTLRIRNCSKAHNRRAVIYNKCHLYVCLEGSVCISRTYMKYGQISDKCLTFIMWAVVAISWKIQIQVVARKRITMSRRYVHSTTIISIYYIHIYGHKI